MCLITHTNIVVDSFSYGKSNPAVKYIYFLSHFHSDHWQGITPRWSFGPIYCTPITKKLLLNRFPDVPDVHELELDIEHTIYLNPEKTLSVKVYMFDANHCPGAAMMLFKGYMGTVLHTGDFRFHMSMIKDNEILYPKDLRTPDYSKCSIHIDELVLDNTFCDPIFRFPNRDEALKEMIGIILKNRGKRIYIQIATLGKEEMLIYLAEYFKTLIVVDERRYSNIVAIDYRPELFTTDPTQGWILLNSVQDGLQDAECSVHIGATGWANGGTYSSGDGKKYIVPYSLHSNFEEMETFVRSIHPSKIRCVVKNTNTSQKINNITQFGGYMNTVMHLKQRGIEMFNKYYTDPKSLSDEYKYCNKEEVKLRFEKELHLRDENGNIPQFKPEELKEFNELKRQKWSRKNTAEPSTTTDKDKAKFKRSKTVVNDAPRVRDKKEPIKKTVSYPADTTKTPESKTGQSRTTTQVPSPESETENFEDFREEFSVSENTKGIENNDDRFGVRSMTWNSEFGDDSRPIQAAAAAIVHYGKINFGSAEKVKHEPENITNKAPPQTSEDNTVTMTGLFHQEFNGKSQQDLVDLYKEVYQDEPEEKNQPSQIYKHLKEISEKEDENSQKGANFSFAGSKESTINEPIAICSSSVAKITEKTSFILSQVIPEEPAETKKETKNPYENFAFVKKEKRSKDGSADLKRKYSEISSASTAATAGSMKTSQFGSKQTDSVYALDKKKVKGSDEKKSPENSNSIGQSQLIQWFSKKK